MYKYIITWTITTCIPSGGSDLNRADEFGTENNHIVYTVYTWTTFDETKTKEFKVKDSAIAFYKRGFQKVKHLSDYSYGSEITEIKIDSILVK